MDGQRFDALTRAFAISSNRRTALRVLAGAGGALLGVRARRSEVRAGNGPCAHFCVAIYPPGPQRGACISAAAHGDGLCPACGQDAANVCYDEAGQPYCPDRQTDPLNCGGCGITCGLDEFCCGGSCIPVCTAIDQCHDVGVCDPSQQACTNPVRADGTPCDDGDACTQGDTCQGGQCVGTPVSCDSPGPCQLAPGTCNPADGSCIYPNKSDGSPCGDGDYCNGAESCQGGVCTAGAPVVCEGAGTVCGGTCDEELDQCVYPGSDTVCAPAFCDGETAVAASTCNGQGGCVEGVRTPCGPCEVCQDGSCVANPACECQVCTEDGCIPADNQTPCPLGECCNGVCCNGSCCPSGFGDFACIDTQNDDENCGFCGNVCFSDAQECDRGQCRATQGFLCSTNEDCVEGLLCQQGVCCSQPCDGVCNSCDVDGSLGSCVARPSGFPCTGGYCSGGHCCDGGPSGVCSPADGVCCSNPDDTCCPVSTVPQCCSDCFSYVDPSTLGGYLCCEASGGELCGDTCCIDGETCVNGVCTTPERACDGPGSINGICPEACCGGTCCASDEICINGSCQPANQPCFDDVDCPGGSECVGGVCCAGYRICGDVCCEHGYACRDNEPRICCPYSIHTCSPGGSDSCLSCSIRTIGSRV